MGGAWWEGVVGAWRTSPRLTMALGSVTVLAAVLPTGSSLASGTILHLLPEVVAEGMDSPAGARMIVALGALAACYVALQLMGPLQLQVFGEGLGRKYMGWMHRRVMRATLRPATIRHLEDPRLHDKVRQSLGEGNVGARVTGIAGIPPGLARLAGGRLRGLTALAVVAHFSPWLALLLAAVWLHHLHRLRGLHNQLTAVRLVRTPAMRYAQYLGALPVSADVAKEVRVFGLGEWLGEKFERTWLGEMAVLWARRRGAARTVALATVPVLAAQVGALGLIGWATASGEMGLGALLVYATAVRQSEAFGGVSLSGLELQYGMAGFKPLAELEHSVAHSPSLALSGTRSATGLPKLGIRFEGVSFTYPGRSEPVFQDLTLDIPAGRSLAIVGDNGAGKTTLIKLLARLHDPDAGRITVDGVDLREIAPREWQRRVAAIFQDFVKYQLPAYDNIALGAPERQEERAMVMEAARRAGARELIEGLPKGWETILSREYTGGADLSGGQWQRIGLARALFAASAGASVLVLDEPTAHLDVRAEAAFYDSFLDLTAGMTTAIISHRFSTVRRADRIVVLEGGKVIEDGGHDDLMRAGGRYAYLFGLQAQRFTDGTGTSERTTAAPT